MKSKGYGQRRDKGPQRLEKRFIRFCLFFAAIPLLLLIFTEFLLPAEDSRGIPFFFKQVGGFFKFR